MQRCATPLRVDFKEHSHTTTSTSPTATTDVLELMNHLLSGCLPDLPSRFCPHHS
jgi:hypothetical protein